MRAHYEKCYNSEIVELFESDDESQMTNEALQHSAGGQVAAAVTIAGQSCCVRRCGLQ